MRQDSSITEIKGIGEKTKKELILHFKSVKRVRMASLEELTKIIGTHRASIVYNHFSNDLSL